MQLNREGLEGKRYRRNGVALIVSYVAALMMVATLAAVGDDSTLPGAEITVAGVVGPR
ncbi:MAG: hypothetical protein IT168_13490 [Bryobacterales bacterium]|nr:hypothetical protein [Bryobacterales bacterium]